MFEQKEQESRMENARQKVSRSSASKPLNNGKFSAKSSYVRPMVQQQQTKQDQDTKSQAPHQPISPSSSTPNAVQSTASNSSSAPKHHLPIARNLNTKSTVPVWPPSGISSSIVPSSK